MKNNNFMKIIKYFALFLILTVFTACSQKGPTYLELNVLSDKELNQDKLKISSPLMLVFYELQSAENFLKLDYWDLLEKDGEKLKSDLISQHKQVIIPKEKHLYKIVFDEKAKFLGLIGKFSDISKPTWKYVINLEKGKTNEVYLKVIDYKIEVNKDGE